MFTNLAFFFETSKKLRGGKWVWYKDGNGERRGNVLLGGTILNPKKGFDHLFAAQLVQYTPAQGCLIFRSFKTKAAVAAAATTIVIEGDGYSDAPEVGMLIMAAPQTATGVGQSAKITDVVYDEGEQKFTVTVDTALGALTAGTILVEAAGNAAAAEANVLVPNPNCFVEADADLNPTEGYGISNGDYSIAPVWDKIAWIERMQPLPAYVLSKNRSYIDGVFWI